MGTVSRVHTFASGAVLTAAQLNNEFDNLLTSSAINGGLDATNLGVTAGQITASKAIVVDGSRNLDDGTTSNQINNLVLSGTLAVAGATTQTGALSIDSTTDSTSTTTGSIHTDGGVGIAKDLIVGNDVKLLTDSAVLSLGVGSDATLTHDGTTGLTIAANPITVDSGDALTLDAHTGIHIFKDAGTEVLRFTEGNSGDVTIKLATNGKDLIFTDHGDATGLKVLDAAAGINVPGEVQTTKIAYTDGDDAITIADGGGVTTSGTFESGGAATLASLVCTAAGTFGGGYGATGATISTAGVIQANGAITSDGAVTGATLAGTVSTAAQNSITSASSLATVGTIGTGVWQGTAVASAYLDADTAHLSTTQTFTGDKTFTGTLTVGVDDTGKDVKFFGASAGAYMEWDESADQLRILGPSADAADSSGKLLLATAQTAVAANDILGQIDFQAPFETGTDATAIAAAIRAVAQGTFSASVNATDLIFYTGHSEAATEKFRMTSQGELGVGGANYGTDGQVLTSGGAGAAPTWADASGGSFSGPGSSTDNAVVRFNGTGGATGQNSGVTIDDSNNATGFANLTLSGELDAATGDFSGAVDIAGDLTLSAGADGALTFSAASSIKMLDNSATSLVIEEADNAYMTFVTTNSSEAVLLSQDAMIADGSGLISGHTARVQVGYATGENQILGTGDADANLSITRFSNDNGPPNLFFGKSRSGSLGGQTIVADGDPLGRIIFAGSDGVDMRSVGAVIEAECDGEFEADNISGRIVFATTPDDAGVQDAVERMRIDSSGNVGIGTTAPIQPLHVATSSGANVLFQLNADSGENTYAARRSRGSAGSPTAIQTDDTILALGAEGYDGSTYAGRAQLKVLAAENWSGSARGTKFAFYGATAGQGGLDSTAWMTLYNGKVGIGTSAPAGALTVATAGGTSEANAVVLEGTGDEVVWLRWRDNWSADSGDVRGAIQCSPDQSANNGSMSFYTTNSGTLTRRLFIDKDGDFTGSSSADISDARLKENVISLTGCLAKVNALRGVSYNFLPAAKKNADLRYGLVAQEVEAVIPDIVWDKSIHDVEGVEAADAVLYVEGDEIPEGQNIGDVKTPAVEAVEAESYKSLHYTGLIPVFIEAIKELTTRLGAAEAKIAALESA
jgi:hypothetical protein